MAQLQITFDDGPLPIDNALTPILGELAKRRIVAAFFNLGNEVALSAKAAKVILGNGHVLGNHSWDHLETPATDSEIVEQFQKTHDEVFKATGVKMKHWRAPRLAQIARLTKLLTVGSKSLYTLSHCDVQADSRDSEKGRVISVDGMLSALRNDLARIPSTARVVRLLFHVKVPTAAALPQVLDGLLADGHTFVDFSQSS